MMHLPASVRVYLCTSACDMRKSFDGLHAMVTQSMQLEAFGGHLFVFANRRRDPGGTRCRAGVHQREPNGLTCRQPFPPVIEGLIAEAVLATERAHR